VKSLEEKKVGVYVRSTLKEIKEDGRLTIERNGGMETIGPFDSIVLATGGIPYNELAAKLAGKVAKVITIGDAKSFRKAIDAIEEGYRAGLEV
jgi:NADPH-dependent 2,4-dienoyl-CoA reductase/sulfur reductase-like enzyme